MAFVGVYCAEKGYEREKRRTEPRAPFLTSMLVAWLVLSNSRRGRGSMGWGGPGKDTEQQEGMA